MIASVTASEAAKAQTGNLVHYVYTNCNLEGVRSTGGGAEVTSNGPPERVTAPYVVPLPNEWMFNESGCFVLQP